MTYINTRDEAKLGQVKKIKINFLQKKRLLIAFITLWLSIFIVVIYQGIEKSHASFYYNTNNLPPRTQQLCYNEFIGVEYNPMHERRCRGLWTEWTNEIKSASPYYFLNYNIMGWFDRPLSDEEKLQNKIKLIVSNWENKGTSSVSGSGVTIHYDNFEIRIETNGSCERLYHHCFVMFNTKVLYSNSNGESDSYFLLELCKIVYQKEKAIENDRKKLIQVKLKEEEENKKLNRQLLISDALAYLMGVELQKVSKEVKDELSPIFSDVTRVQEITSELNTIRRRYSAGGI